MADQELLLTRLAMGIVEREDDDVTMEKLDKALVELFNKKVTKLLMPYLKVVWRGGGVFCFRSSHKSGR